MRQRQPPKPPKEPVAEEFIPPQPPRLEPPQDQEVRYPTLDAREWVMPSDLRSQETEERLLMLKLEELAKIEGLREPTGTSNVTTPRSSYSDESKTDGKADDTHVLKRDGSVQLTRDWDAGDYEIKAASFAIVCHEDTVVCHENEVVTN